MFRSGACDSHICTSGVNGGLLDGSGNSQAWSTCNNLNFANHTDGRVPEKWELKSLSKCTDGTTPLDGTWCGSGNYTSPTIDTNLFPNFPNIFFWTSTSYAGNSDFAWYVGFHIGNVNGSNKDAPRAVLCLR